MNDEKNDLKPKEESRTSVLNKVNFEAFGLCYYRCIN